MKIRSWLLIAALLIGVGLIFVWCDHALLFTQLGGAFILLVLSAIVLRSIANIAISPANTRDELPVLLGVLGLVIVVLWISQGVFATQINIKMNAQASPDPQGGQTLVTVAIMIENTGVRQAEIKHASLFVCPGTSPSWKDLFNSERRNAAHIEFRDMEALGFGGPAETEFGGDKHDKYFLVWGTQEARQMVFLLPKAPYYDIRFSLGTGEVATNSINKWRASTIVPMTHEWVQKDAKEGPLVGKSVEQERASGDSKSSLTFLKKMLGIGSE